MLSLRSLRFLHRCLDDFVVIQKVKSGTVSVVELERILRDSGADVQEFSDVLTDYRKHRSELQSGEKL